MTKRAITVGVSNGNYVEVKSGLSEGETVYAEAEEDAQATGLAALFGQMGGGQQPPQDMGERRNGEGQRNGERAGGNGSGGNGPGGNGGGSR